MATKKKKSYKVLLDEIPDQIRRASLDVPSAIIDCLEESKATGAILIGSGGSLTSAHFYAHLIEKVSRKQCAVYTPLELLCSAIDLEGQRCLFFSAEGKNPDIIHAFEYANKHKAIVTCVTNFNETPLGQLCERTNQKNVCLPVHEKDGFLALSTIVATMIAGYKAFGAIQPQSELTNLSNVADAVIPRVSTPDKLNKLNKLIVVYAPLLKPAAIDIESRFHESGVASVQIADIRNFSHGRHYGAFLNQDETHIIILADEGTAALARLTRLAINTSLSNSLILFSGAPVEAMFRSVLFSMHLLWEIAEPQNREPNKVLVPKFGRSLYYLPYQSSCLTQPLVDASDVPLPSHYYNTSFDAVVFDYDGTLCDSDERFDELKPIVALMLERLLEHGVRVGIATGRGKSAGISIRKAIEEKWWEQIVIGYYNGSIIETAEKTLDVSQYPIDPVIKNAHDFISSKRLSGTSVDMRPTQITIEFGFALQSDTQIDVLCAQLIEHCPDIKVLRSGHSIDIINKSTSKLRVIGALHHAKQCLTVGDSGQPGGNDHELLSHPFSISVNHVSGHADTGFKIGTLDEIELSATLRLFSMMQFGQGVFTLGDGS